MKNLIWSTKFDISNSTPEQHYAGLLCVSKNSNKNFQKILYGRSGFNRHKF